MFDFLFGSKSSGAAFLPEWREVVAERLPHWRRLGPEDRSRLEDLTLHLMFDKTWEAAKDFTVTDEIKVTIAAQAALLALNLPGEPYRNISSILVHPTTYVRSGERYVGDGIYSDEPEHLLGQAQYNGPVLIAWDDVLNSARQPNSGTNVVIHEFAHKLDMLDGVVDGTPPLDFDRPDRWSQVCTPIYQAVVEGTAKPSLNSYAGVSPAEFFAVATETFFVEPSALRSDYAELYELLSAFYRQDPASLG